MTASKFTPPAKGLELLEAKVGLSPLQDARTTSGSGQTRSPGRATWLFCLTMGKLQEQVDIINAASLPSALQSQAFYYQTIDISLECY